MKKHQQKQNVGRLIRSMREDSGLTQEALAAEMDVGRNTVVAWEHGSGQMINELFRWRRLCDVTGKDPVRTAILATAPERIGSPSKDITLEEKRKALHGYLDTVATDIIIEMLYAEFMQDHGSDPEAMVNEWLANLHTPLSMRHGIAQHVSSNYKIAQRVGEDPCPDVIQPNIDLLDTAVAAGFLAAMNGARGYAIVKK